MDAKIFAVLALIAVGISPGWGEDEVKSKSEKEKVELKYTRPEVSGHAYISEPFDSKTDFDNQWILSQAKKDGVDAAISKYDGQWSIEEPSDNPIKGDLGLVLKTKAKHHAVSTMLPMKYEFKDRPFMLQYEVKFQNPMECGGAYLKLLSEHPKLDLEEFTDKTGYTIMFGPDKCGEDSKLHFIFRHKNPVNGKYEEKHAKMPDKEEFQKIFDDKKTHLVTLIVKPDNTFEILVDKRSINSGSLLKDFTPAVNPPKEIDDPTDKKPSDWDDREKIEDPDAKKPDDWDEDAPKKIPDPNAKKPDGWLDDAPENIPDPNAKRPADWDDEEDGEWEAPQIANPKCTEIGCGKWKPPMIDNPNYKGKWEPPMITNPKYKGVWAPRKIPNPDFFEDNDPFKMTPIVAVGLELWSMTDNILFDNIIIADEQSVLDKWTADTWDLKYGKEFEAAAGGEGGIVDNLIDATKERPWLWFVYVVVVFLPFILILAFCFPSKKDKDAERKKTDEPTPDDDQETEAKEGEENESDKAKADSDEGEKPQEEAKEDEDKEEKVEDNKDEEKDEPPPDASPRTRASKRKTRKDT